MKKSELKQIIKECLSEIDSRKPLSFDINKPPLPSGWKMEEGLVVIFDEQGRPRSWSKDKGLAIHNALTKVKDA